MLTQEGKAGGRQRAQLGLQGGQGKTRFPVPHTMKPASYGDKELQNHPDARTGRMCEGRGMPTL